MGCDVLQLQVLCESQVSLTDVWQSHDLVEDHGDDLVEIVVVEQLAALLDVGLSAALDALADQHWEHVLEDVHLLLMEPKLQPPEVLVDVVVELSTSLLEASCSRCACQPKAQHLLVLQLGVLQLCDLDTGLRKEGLIHEDPELIGDELANGVGYGFAPSEEEGAELGDKRVLALLAGTSITKSSLVPGTKKELVIARFLAVDMDDSMQGIKVGEGKRRARSGRR